MKKNIFYCITLLLCINFVVACKKNEQPQNTSEAKLIFKFKFDKNQERLNNLGLPSVIPVGNAAQSPVFNGISAHYAELSPTMFTPFGNGTVIYKAPETTQGGAQAIDFEQSKVVAENEVFLELPLKNIAKGTYQYLRLSLAYQNYDLNFLYRNTQLGVNLNLTATIASFLGFNTYIKNYTIKNEQVSVNANQKQGYWGAETPYVTLTGNAPATTVPNPIQSTSPVPAGSCVVTAPFEKTLQITGNETQDIVVTVSLSTNNSFEWNDINPDGKWEPAANELPVDMGVRGMKVWWE